MIRSMKWRQLFNIRQLSLLPSSSRRLSSFAKHAEKYETISVSVDEEGVAKILMNRPDKMNAMNWRMWKELKESFEVVNKDPSVRCIILGSTSNHFSTGMDLSVFAEMVQSHHKEKCPGRAREKLENTIDFFQSTCTGAEACNVPVICAIDGNAIGGAVDLLTACCLRYCTKQANFSVKEIDLAIVADVGTLQRLPNIVGEQRTRELAYTGRHFNGEEAMNLGLVLNCFDTSDEMMNAVETLALEIAKKSPLTMRNIKRNIKYSREHTTEDSLEHVRMMNSSILFSEDLEKVMGTMMSKGDISKVTFRD